jgi:hypothetical protein
VPFLKRGLARPVSANDRKMAIISGASCYVSEPKATLKAVLKGTGLVFRLTRSRIRTERARDHHPPQSCSAPAPSSKPPGKKILETSVSLQPRRNKTGGSTGAGRDALSSNDDIVWATDTVVRKNNLRPPTCRDLATCRTFRPKMPNEIPPEASKPSAAMPAPVEQACPSPAGIALAQFYFKNDRRRIKRRWPKE